MPVNVSIVSLQEIVIVIKGDRLVSRLLTLLSPSLRRPDLIDLNKDKDRPMIEVVDEQAGFPSSSSSSSSSSSTHQERYLADNPLKS